MRNLKFNVLWWRGYLNKAYKLRVCKDCGRSDLFILASAILCIVIKTIGVDTTLKIYSAQIYKNNQIWMSVLLPGTKWFHIWGRCRSKHHLAWPPSWKSSPSTSSRTSSASERFRAEKGFLFTKSSSYFYFY